MKRISTLVAAAVMALGFNTASHAEQRFALYSTSAADIRVTPLVSGGMPDLSTGVDLHASAPCEDDMTQPPRIVPLNSGDFLTIWWNKQTDSACYSRFTPNGNNGDFTETHIGAWDGAGNRENMWVPLSANDMNGDGLDDLVLFRWGINGANVRDYKLREYKAAPGKSDGSFDFSGTPVTFVSGMRAIMYTVADADGDSHTDLVFHSFRSGGTHPTELYMLRGMGDGTFAATQEHLLSTASGQGSNTVVFADFNTDGIPDAFLPPDDDVSDEGQSYINLGQGSGNFTPVVHSIDFVPEREGQTHDRFSASGQAYDVDLDGHADLVINEDRVGISVSKKVYRGDGNGEFTATGEELYSAPNGAVFPRLAFITVPEKQACGTVVIYSTDDRKLSFDMLAMELYNPITDEPAGKFALFTGGDMSLKALPGFYDFKYGGGEPVYAGQIVEKSDNCYPTYSAEDETLQFPKIKVPLLGVLPDGSTVDGPAACYKAEFNHSMTQPEIFTLADANEVACE
ncbi:MAG: VCBS repeat-containing protein [Gammaproteobacteria bacterium]|nr:VCBS repeat-containing protein [Gammaproteobacteria bacterium]